MIYQIAPHKDMVRVQLITYSQHFICLVVSPAAVPSKGFLYNRGMIRWVRQCTYKKVRKIISHVDISQKQKVYISNFVVLAKGSICNCSIIQWAICKFYSNVLTNWERLFLSTLVELLNKLPDGWSKIQSNKCI